MINWSARSIERAAVPAAKSFRAPLFRSLVELFDADQRYVVLDLGVARTQTIALLSQYRCRLDIADLGDGLDELNALTERQDLDKAAEALLPAPHGEPTDVVLCWDIVNYLEPPALRALTTRIAARARPGTIMHGLIVYAQTHMPMQPGHYVPLEDFNLLNTAARPDERPAPRYSPDDLCRFMPGYAIERAMLLSNGMQEFLFRL